MHEKKEPSFQRAIYSKIPEDHIMKQLKRAIDVSFINDLLEDSYCKRFKRPWQEPEVMFKLLFLKHIYLLSDDQILKIANVNLDYLCFLDINPEDPLPEKSLLAEFRKLKIGDQSLDEVINKIYKDCEEKGVLSKKIIKATAPYESPL